MEGSLTSEQPAADDYKPDLAALKRMFEDSRDLTYDARRDAMVDQDYYDGYQWTAEERATLKKRLQPDLVFNRVRPAINGTLGVIKQGSTDPRAYPRNPQDEDSADVASKTLRYVADYNRFDDLKIKGAKDYLVSGTCAAIVEVDADRQIIINPIRHEEFFYDPRSRREDFKDARYMGVAKWQYADDVLATYPDAKTEIESTIAAGSPIALDEMYEDRPKDGQTSWVDKKKRRLMVVEIYHLDGGKWYRCCFHSGGVLAGAVSPYVDRKGKPSNPIEAQSCFVDRENNRYGLVRDMRGPQDEINKRRSKLLHELNVRALRANVGAMPVDADEMRKEGARPDAVLPEGWDYVSRADVVAGQASLLQEAKAEIERMGPNPAILGRQGENQSGRANLIRQQAGLTEQAIIFGGIEDWELRLYRQMWDRAGQWWTAPMYIRVTDDEGAPEFVHVNEPEHGPPQIVTDPQTGLPTIQRPILGYKNQLAELDVDIMLDSVPDTANIQQEQFQLLAELAKSYPQDVTFDDLLEASSMPNKRQIVERRKARKEEAQQQQQDPMREVAMRGAVAEVEKTVSEAELNRAKTQTELAKPQIDALEALNQPQGYPAAGGF